MGALKKIALAGIVAISISGNVLGNIFSISGSVTEKNSGKPVPNHLVTIASYNPNSSDGTVTAINTNEDGLFSASFAIPDGTRNGFLVSTADKCSPTGEVYQIVYSDSAFYTVNFSVCTVSDTLVNECYTSFSWHPADSIFTIPELFALQFKGFSQPDAVSWNWDFGDGTSSTDQNPVHIFSMGSTNNVCLTTTTVGNCISTYCATVDFTYTDTSTNDCVANFYYYPMDATNQYESSTYAFQDVSYPNPDSWLWDFSDGSTSNEQNPVYTFQDTGVYNVCLKIVSGECSSTTCQTIYIGAHDTIIYPDCQASFWYNQVFDNPNGTVPPMEPYTIQFHDQSYPTPAEFFWVFPDSTTSNDAEPIKVFYGPGEYLVCLIIKSNNCENKVCEVIYLAPDSTVYDQCQAMFYAYPNDSIYTFAEGYPYSFVDISVGNPSKWHWDFGDGNSSNNQNPMHIYSNEGTYLVSLAISNDSCSSTISLPIWVYNTYIDSTYRDCFSDFWFIKDSSANCINCYQFYDLSSEKAISWAWDFGDGNISTERNPSHSFADGIYWVTLTTTNTSGCSSTSNQLLSTSEDYLFDEIGTAVIDSIYLPPVDSCFIDFNIDIDSAYVTSFDIINSTTIEVTWEIWQDGNLYQITKKGTCKNEGNIVVYLTIVCSDLGGKGNNSVTLQDIINVNKGFQDVGATKLIEFSLYPNPVNDRLYIIPHKLNTSKFTITISNLVGQNMYIREYNAVNDQQIEINTDKLEKGIYLITIITNKGRLSAKFIK